MDKMFIKEELNRIKQLMGIIIEGDENSNNELTKEEALENLKEIFKSNTFLYDERELPNININRFNSIAINLYKVAKAILTEQELNKVLEKLSISDVNNLPLNKAIELSIGLKGVLLSRENISDKVGVLRGFSDKSNYDYLINDIPFSNKFKIVTEDSLKRDQDISFFITGFVKKLKSNNVGSISNVAHEGHIIQVNYDTEKQNITTTPETITPTTSNIETNEQPLSDLLNQVNDALEQFDNPRLLTTKEELVFVRNLRSGVMNVKYYGINKNDSFELNLPKDLNDLLVEYNINVTGRMIYFQLRNSKNIDVEVAKKYGLPSETGDTLRLNLKQPYSFK
jgi:hypothetical protein